LEENEEDQANIFKTPGLMQFNNAADKKGTICSQVRGIVWGMKIFDMKKGLRISA